MPIDMTVINIETNVSEDEEIAARKRLKQKRLQPISVAELNSMLDRPGFRGANYAVQSVDDIDNFAPNVASACQWNLPSAVKNFLQAMSQANISEMMPKPNLANIWRNIDDTE